MFTMATGDIGKRIREARETFRGVGMKQKDLADRIGVSRARLSNWENGMHDPHPYEIINRVAQVLEVPIEFIRGGIQRDSTVRPTKVWAVQESEIKNVLGMLDPTRVEECLTVLRSALGQ